SYLQPMLAKKRDLFILPFSNKPYGCFQSPFAFPYNPTKEQKIKYILPESDSYMPSIENENNYFNYLNNETILTKEFIKKNWYKLVLIDSSAGQSIMGVSIFLNRYIGNIPQSARCIEIEKTEPLRFIDLIMIKNIGQINTCPELAYKIYKNSGKIY